MVSNFHVPYIPTLMVERKFITLGHTGEPCGWAVVFTLGYRAESIVHQHCERCHHSGSYWGNKLHSSVCMHSAYWEIEKGELVMGNESEAALRWFRYLCSMPMDRAWLQHGNDSVASLMAGSRFFAARSSYIFNEARKKFKHKRWLEERLWSFAQKRAVHEHKKFRDLLYARGAI